MGIGIFVPNADFSSLNLGQVTPLQDIPVTAIAIAMNSSYSGTTFTPSITYTPTNSNKKGVTWSIIAGGAYATINATTGVVTILSTANASNITIQAVSNYDSSIVSTATTAVTYIEQVIDVTSVTITGADTMSLNGTLTAAILPANATAQTVTWAVTSGSSLVTMTTNGNTANFVVNSSGSITVTATAGGVTATKTITVSDTISDSSIISFEDSTAKSLCVAAADIDEDGEISVGELKSILILTSIMANGAYTKFNEFKYFTKLTYKQQTNYNAGFFGNTTCKELTIPNNLRWTDVQGWAGTSLFYNNKVIEEVHFPENMIAPDESQYLDTVSTRGVQTRTGNQLFDGCTSLKRCRLPNNIATISSACFRGCTSLTDVILGTGVTTLVEMPFQTNTVLASIVVLASTPPPNITSNYAAAFLGVTAANAHFKVYVPDASVDAYKAAYGWTNYASIILPLSQYTGDYNKF